MTMQVEISISTMLLPPEVPQAAYIRASLWDQGNQIDSIQEPMPQGDTFVASFTATGSGNYTVKAQAISEGGQGVGNQVVQSDLTPHQVVTGIA